MARRQRNQTKARRQKPQSATPAKQFVPLKVVLLWLFAAGGWLTAVLTGALEFPQKINLFYVEKDRALANLSPRFDKSRFVGRWTNDDELHPSRTAYVEDPDGQAPADRGTLQLVIAENADGSFSGEIVSAKILDTSLPWTAVQLEGQVGRLGGFEGAIVDGVFGRRTTLGYFKLLPGDESGDYVEFSAPKKFSQIVPTKALLWRTNADFSGGESNPRFMKMLSENSEQILEQRRKQEATAETESSEQAAVPDEQPLSE